MSRRAAAEAIVALRRLIILGLVARLKEDRPAERLAGDEFTALAQQLPISVTRKGGLIRYVEAPAYRKIEREGILAQAEREQNR